MKKAVLVAAVFASFASLSASAFAAAGVVGATAGDGGAQRTYEHVSVTVSDEKGPVSGVQCTLSNDKGSWNVTAPDDASIRRSKGDLTVTCQKSGYDTVTGTLAAGTTEIAQKSFKFGTDAGGDGEDDAQQISVPQYAPTINVTLQTAGVPQASN
jgi:hypothetical protein